MKQRGVDYRTVLILIQLLIKIHSGHPVTYWLATVVRVVHMPVGGHPLLHSWSTATMGWLLCTRTTSHFWYRYKVKLAVYYVGNGCTLSANDQHGIVWDVS